MLHQRDFAQHDEVDPLQSHKDDQLNNRSSLSPGSSAQSRDDQGFFPMPSIALTSSSPCASPFQVAINTGPSDVDLILDPQKFRTFNTRYEEDQPRTIGWEPTISDFALAMPAAGAFHTSMEDIGQSKHASKLKLPDVSSSGSQTFEDSFTLDPFDYVPMPSSHMDTHQSDSHDPDFLDILDPGFDLGLDGWNDGTVPPFTDINGEIILSSNGSEIVNDPDTSKQTYANTGHEAQSEGEESLAGARGTSKGDRSSRIVDLSDTRQRKRLVGTFGDVNRKAPMKATHPNPNGRGQIAPKWPANPFSDSPTHQNLSAYVPEKRASTDFKPKEGNSVGNRSSMKRLRQGQPKEPEQGQCVGLEGRSTVPSIGLSDFRAPSNSVKNSTIPAPKVMSDHIASPPAQVYTDNSANSIPKISPRANAEPEEDDDDDDVIGVTRRWRLEPKVTHPEIHAKPMAALVEDQEGKVDRTASQVGEDRKEEKEIEEEEAVSRKRRRKATGTELVSGFVTHHANLVPWTKNLNRKASRGLAPGRKLLRSTPGIDQCTSSPKRPTDYREKEPNTKAEYKSLQEALLPTRIAYYEWTGADAPVTDGWQSYMDQWEQIEASFESTWGMSQRVLTRKPRLFKLPAWRGSVEDWPQPVKDKFYYAPFKYGHWAPVREDGMLMDLPGELLEEASHENDREAFMKGVMCGLKHMAPVIWKHHYS